MKSKLFYLSLIIIYALFLTKDNLLYFLSTKKESYSSVKESYYENEYHNLAKLLDLENNDFKIVYSKVLRRDIYEFNDKIIINVGTNQEVKKGDPIINEKGVVGLISKVNKNYSEVTLLTSSNINLSVKINDSYGLIKSKNEQIMVVNIKGEQKIKEGDKIYTSGLTNIKEGLLIGEVKTIKKDDLGLEYLIEVTPAVNFNQLHYIGVIQ